MIVKLVVEIVLYTIELNQIEKGAASLHPLGAPEYLWEIVGIYYVTDLPRSGSHGYTSVFIVAYHKKE